MPQFVHTRYATIALWQLGHVVRALVRSWIWLRRPPDRVRVICFLGIAIAYSLLISNGLPRFEERYKPVSVSTFIILQNSRGDHRQQLLSSKIFLEYDVQQQYVRAPAYLHEQHLGVRQPWRVIYH